MTEKGQRDEVRKLTAEMFWILLISAAAAVFLLVAMYRNRFGAYAFADSHGLLLDGREEYREWFLSQAPGYTLMPEKGKQYDAEERLPFVEKHCNKYIGVGIYEKSSGDYVAGYFPHMLTEQFFWSDWLWNDSAIMSSTELPMKFTAHFKDKEAEVLLYSYRAMQMIPFYFGGGVLLAVLVVLSPVLLFVHRRMGYLGKIREEVLVMAQGDLEHPLTVRGKDELASLSRELDCLRLALKENMEKEQGSREANRELIRAVSHDIRTPLTALTGYLEILNHTKGSREKYPEYLCRCLKKTEEIRALSDKMFEYALVFDSQDKVEKQELSFDFLEKELREQEEYLRMQGFCLRRNGVMGEGFFYGNGFLIKRLLWNLFSNILRYGDREKPVDILLETEEKYIRLCLKNAVCETAKGQGSGVGLKSAERIAALHGGSLVCSAEENSFIVRWKLPF